MSKRAAVWILIVTLGGMARAQELPKCSADEVAVEPAKLLHDQICAGYPLMLKDVVANLAIESPAVKLENGRTVGEETAPPKKRCHADLSFDLVMSAEPIGPVNGRAVRFRAKMEPDGVDYSVERYDDGRLYVGILSDHPKCWGVSSLTREDRPAP